MTKDLHLQHCTGDSSGAELCARILKSLAKAAWCLWRILTVFTCLPITPPEVKWFRWKLGHSEYIVNCHCPWQGTHYRHLSNYIEPSVYSGDEPNVELLSPLVIFGCPHRNRYIISLPPAFKSPDGGVPAGTISVKFSVDVNGWPRYRMVKNKTRKRQDQ